MYLDRPTTKTEARALIGMVQYYKYMWTVQYHILEPLTEAAADPKYRKLICNDALWYYFKELNHMVSVVTLLNYLYKVITFTLHTDADDK